jgi:uncharacterized lipoprotein NlpE involved in copper resistance
LRALCHIEDFKSPTNRSCLKSLDFVSLFLLIVPKIKKMKKSILSIVLVLVVMLCYSQGKKGVHKANAASIDASQVPDAVKQAFSVTTSDLKWEKHTLQGKKGNEHTRYVAVYTQAGTRMRSRFKADGSKLSTSRYMRAASVPATVATSATNKNQGAKLMGAEEITTKNGDVVYRVRLRNGSTKISTLLNAQGTEISKEKVMEEIKEGEIEEGDEGK